MNAEQLLIKIKEFIEENHIVDGEVLVTPTMYDPDQLQNDVTFIIFDDVEENGEVVGKIPRYKVNVKDLEAIRNWEKVKNEL